MASWNAVASRIGTAKAEMGSAIAALILAFGVAIVLLGGGALRLRANNAAGFFVTVFLGPLLALGGAWLDLRQRQALGVMLLALAALLALDGSFATYFVGLPTFLLVAASFGSALLRRGTQAIQQA
jgi:hypothetical protein